MAQPSGIAYRTPGPGPREAPPPAADDTLTSLVPHITATHRTPLPAALAASAATVAMPRYESSGGRTAFISMPLRRALQTSRRRLLLGALLVLGVGIGLGTQLHMMTRPVPEQAPRAAVLPAAPSPAQEAQDRGRQAPRRALLRAVALLNAGQVTQAQELLRARLLEAPVGREALAARLVLLRSQIQQGELAAAQRLIEQILAEHPVGLQRAQARLLLAQLGLQQRPPLRDEALALLRSVAEEAPGLAETSLLLRDPQRLQQAGAALERAVLDDLLAGASEASGLPADAPGGR